MVQLLVSRPEPSKVPALQGWEYFAKFSETQRAKGVSSREFRIGSLAGVMCSLGWVERGCDFNDLLLHASL